MKTVEDLKSVHAEAILRLNCPGFGRSDLLTCGQARPLSEYKVIIVNPVSIIHLFESDEALIRQIDLALADGLTSCKLSDDKVITKIAQQIEGRSPELFQFLAEGGLLIYYLCRPFVVSSEVRVMDNYAWLCGLAPDQSGESTVSEQTVRHMSTVAHGRNVDKCAIASESEFEKYIEQAGLEWNTIIRTDFLTSGYYALAQAGPKKCIAGELIAGDNGGKVVFLPAPYSPDFDRVLIECINLWHATKMGFELSGVKDRAGSANGEDSEYSEQNEQGGQLAGVEMVNNNQTPELEIKHEPGQVRMSEEKNNLTTDGGVDNFGDGSSSSEEEAMVDWCKSYWLPGMDGLFKEIQIVRKQVAEMERKLASSENMVSALEEVKLALLSGRHGDLLQSCKIVLSNLGFTVEPNGNNELVLKESDQYLAVVRVCLSTTSPERSEVARLTESLVSFWDSQGIEPKGVLIACTYCNTPVTQRKEADFSKIILEFAAKKNICLISTTQLISIYLSLKLGKLDLERVRSDILSTAGALEGFTL